MTICKKCKHVYNKKGFNEHGWYNWFCKHPDVRRVKTIDPVTGNKRFKGKNDLGQEYLTGQEHPFCRDINNGACQYYKEK
jgi:hypothetical protein